MHILVDGYNLSLEKGTGIATYARNLTYNLKAMNHEVDVLYGYELPGVKFPQAREMAFFDPESQIIKKRARGIVNQLRYLATSWRTRVAQPVPQTGLVVDNGFRSRMPRFDRLLNIDHLYRGSITAQNRFNVTSAIDIIGRKPSVAHWTCPLPIALHGAKNIYTIHDLIPMRLPYTTLDNNRRFVQMVETIAKTASHIVTVSETSRRDIINLLGVPEDRVTNTYQSVEIPDAYINKSPDVVSQEIKGIFGLDYKAYFLFFGAIEPKKNVNRLIEAYLGSGITEPLVIVGEEAWMGKKELILLEREHSDHLSGYYTNGDMMQRRQRVRRIPYASFPTLISLVKGAKAVVAPSIYEGFGLPALEAMLCGTPVITTTEGASPEIVGNGALLVDPYSPAAIRDAIVAINNNAELAAEMSHKGIKRAEYFSAARYQQALTGLYARLQPRS